MTTRFVLLRHEVPGDFPRGSHWDLLLERDEACWTWALEELPRGFAEGEGPATVSALRLKDHRKHYLQYEGPVTGDRGTVRQVLSGHCVWIQDDEDRIEVRLQFAESDCTLLIERTSEDRWQLSTE